VDLEPPLLARRSTWLVRVPLGFFAAAAATLLAAGVAPVVVPAVVLWAPWLPSAIAVALGSADRPWAHVTAHVVVWSAYLWVIVHAPRLTPQGRRVVGIALLVTAALTLRGCAVMAREGARVSW
jgi:hypothetical protein